MIGAKRLLLILFSNYEINMDFEGSYDAGCRKGLNIFSEISAIKESA